MRYRDGRRSICLSSQSGCPLTCTFCATGQMRFGRNLTASEILDQALHFRRIEPVDHCVFMGMGEPMLNLDAVLEAARRLPDLGITHRRTTISTVGWLPGLTRFVDEVEEPIRLALSLHAADPALRSRLMPVNDRYPLEDVIAECRRYVELRRRKVFVEYVMLAGVNDRVEQAAELARLLDPKAFKVNLIPYNPTGAYDGSAPRGDRRVQGRARPGAASRRRCASPAAATSTPPAASSRRAPPPSRRGASRRPRRGPRRARPASSSLSAGEQRRDRVAEVMADDREEPELVVEPSQRRSRRHGSTDPLLRSRVRSPVHAREDRRQRPIGSMGRSAQSTRAAGPTPSRFRPRRCRAARPGTARDPAGVERLAAGTARPPTQDEVARARVHRQPRLDRIPAVVPLDQVVDRVEAPPRRELAPAVEPAGVGSPRSRGAAPSQRGASRSSWPAISSSISRRRRACAGGPASDERVRLGARREVPQPPRQRLADERAVLEVLGEPLGRAPLAHRSSPRGWCSPRIRSRSRRSTLDPLRTPRPAPAGRRGSGAPRTRTGRPRAWPPSPRRAAPTGRRVRRRVDDVGVASPPRARSRASPRRTRPAAPSARSRSARSSAPRGRSAGSRSSAGGSRSPSAAWRRRARRRRARASASAPRATNSCMQSRSNGRSYASFSRASR